MCVELRLALHVKRFLQLAILQHGRIGPARRREGLAGKLRLAARDLRVETGHLHFERGDIGGGEGRIEGSQHLDRLDPLPLVHIDAFDDRWIERLNDDRRLGRDDHAGAGDHPVELGEDREQDQADQEHRHKGDRDADRHRFRGFEDLPGFRLEQPDDLVRRGFTAPRSGTE